jgi:hypothetical protein
MVLSPGSRSLKQPSTANARSSGGSSNATFAQDAQEDAQWQALLKRNRLEGLALSDVIAALWRFLLPVVEAAASNSPLPGQRKSGGPWSCREGV